MAVPHSFLTRGLSFTHEEPSSVLSTPSSPSSASEDSRESSPAFDSPKADAAFEHVEGERRTTTQGKDWRAPANMHKKTFWERTWSEKLLTSTLMSDNHHYLKETNRGPVPSQPLWCDHAFLIPTTFAVPVLQHICFMLGWQWSKPVAFGIYFLGLLFFFQLSALRFDIMGNKYGLFDETFRGRDRIPDESVDIMGGGILMYFLFRVGYNITFKYDPTVAPLSEFTWTYILRWQAWFLVMDYFFYAYHRATHEIDFLWSIHALHHKSKHPTMAHAVLGTHAQHFMEIVIIPTLTSYIVPLSCGEQWVLYLCLAHIETMGHSGIRIHAPCTNTWLSCLPFGAEITIEDHDIHHRYGKSGKNYGKQTMMWDTIFGTREYRVETADCPTRWINDKF